MDQHQSHFLIFLFFTQKIEKLNNRQREETKVSFFHFFLKNRRIMENWTISMPFFYFFSFFEQNGKNEKMV